jgi:hypothetical protein
MVEAVVAIPFFLIIFASTVFIGELYRRKLKSHRESLAAAWNEAGQGCTAPPGVLPGTPPVDLGEASAVPETALCDTGFGDVTEVANGSATAPAIIGGYTANASTATKLICNEQPKTANFEGAAEFLWEQFAPEELELP